MDEIKLKSLIDDGKSLREMSSELGTSLTNLQYWLRKFGLKTKNLSPKATPKKEHINCKSCLKEFKTERNRTVCGTCVVRKRRFILRLAMIQYLGDKCNSCGWSGHMSGYDVHHKDATEKEFPITTGDHKSWNTIKTELDKCVLLCALCHRLIHRTDVNDWLLDSLDTYKGEIPIDSKLARKSVISN